jgi:hypothetical protein
VDLEHVWLAQRRRDRAGAEPVCVDEVDIAGRARRRPPERGEQGRHEERPPRSVEHVRRDARRAGEAVVVEVRRRDDLDEEAADA